MKSLIMALALLSSATAFAAPSDCAKLAGKYSCEHEGQQVGLRVSIVGIKAAIEIDGEAEIYILDGLEHDANDDSQNKASCTNKELVVENTFQGELKAMISIAAQEKGVGLTLVKEAGSIELSCTKVK